MDLAANSIESRLDPGEKLLWTGQPKQGVRLQPQDAFMIPFSLMWGGFSFFWEAGVLGLIHLGNSNRPQTTPPLFMAIFGIPFVLIGIYLIFGRFFFDAASRKKTFYAVTNQRLIILNSFLRFDLTSLDLDATSNLNLSERSDGSGDIVFGAAGSAVYSPGAGWPQSRRGYRVPGFYLLPNAREVFDVIRSARTAARRGNDH